MAFEEEIIKFSTSIDLDSLSDIIYDSFKSTIEIINTTTNKSDADKIVLFEKYYTGLAEGLSIGSHKHVENKDILIIRYINDSIISKYKVGKLSANNAWSDLSDLLSL